ncbi:MmyB family transcriptional regulator [Streptomyces sp. NPDC055036]
MTHPRVGTLTLDLERLLVPSTPGQQLVVYSTEPDSRSHEALRLLAELAD